MPFCYSDMTFNFKLKSHAHCSGSGHRERVPAEEVLSFRVRSLEWKRIHCWVRGKVRAAQGIRECHGHLTPGEMAPDMAEAKSPGRCLSFYL